MNKKVRQGISLILCVIVPLVLLVLFSQPIGSAVRRSETAAFLILSGALGVVFLNWSVYALIHRKRPPLPLFICGILFLTAIEFIMHEALPADSAMTSTLAIIGGCLVLALLLLAGHWFASLPYRPAHAAAVGFWIAYGVILFFMACQIFRDFECRNVTRDTWITIWILIAGVLASCASRIRSACLRRALYRRADHVAMGRIYQVIGETHLDRDDDPVTLNYALVRYDVDGTLYETRAGVSRYAVRRFGRNAFVDRDIPVFYDPSDPSVTFMNRIDRHFFDPDKREQRSEQIREV